MNEKILITGATGLVGKVVVQLCYQRQIDVHYLTTSKTKMSVSKHYKGFYWNPKTSEIDSKCFEGVDTIINLAGASISKRWTSTYKKVILESRIQSLQLLRETIVKEQIKIKHLISASAIGVYPDSRTNYYDEDTNLKSDSFLGQVTQQWEQEVDTFATLGIKTSKIRIGMVLAKDGGALQKMLKPIKLCVGAAFGSGEQWQSWIHVTDLARLFLFVKQYQLEGVFNGVAPNPVTNKELTKAIAKQLERPMLLPNTPKFVLQLALGEMHSLLFESQRVSAKTIEDKGFEFKYHHLPPALNELLIK
ncbi:TIGR01777 family protein [Flavobacteriales bacterium 34_180_T64]|nr:TIGR01777 family protein [Flavobacteriales bacterium 34_180_T64]